METNEKEVRTLPKRRKTCFCCSCCSCCFAGICFLAGFVTCLCTCIVLSRELDANRLLPLLANWQLELPEALFTSEVVVHFRGLLQAGTCFTCSHCSSGDLVPSANAAKLLDCRSEMAQLRAELMDISREVKECGDPAASATRAASVGVSPIVNEAITTAQRTAQTGERKETIADDGDLVPPRIRQEETVDTQEANNANSAELSGTSAMAVPSETKREGAVSLPSDIAWPDCMVFGSAPVGLGLRVASEEFGAVFGEALADCNSESCNGNGGFNPLRVEDCAWACAAHPHCNVWSFGDERHTGRCLLMSDDSAGFMTAAEAVVARKACQPPPTVVSSAQAALSVLELPVLDACDAGITSCRVNLHDAMRTWSFGIEKLRGALADTPTTDNVAPILTQISEDASAFMHMQPEDQQFESVYGIAAANNRQVFNALRGFLSSTPKVDVSPWDPSLPLPVRGMLCKGSCMTMEATVT